MSDPGPIFHFQMAKYCLSEAYKTIIVIPSSSISAITRAVTGSWAERCLWQRKHPPGHSFIPSPNSASWTVCCHIMLPSTDNYSSLSYFGNFQEMITRFLHLYSIMNSFSSEWTLLWKPQCYASVDLITKNRKMYQCLTWKSPPLT